MKNLVDFELDRSNRRVADIIAKLDRADEHLATIKDEWAVFIDGKPCSYILDVDHDAGTYSLKVRINRHPPPRFSAIAGEVIYGLRSSLDHMAKMLVGRGKGLTQFPIFTDADDFHCRVRVPAIKGRGGQLTGLDPSCRAWKIIESVQPYSGQHGPGYHPLGILNRLSNMDKHRSMLARSTSHAVPKDRFKIGGDGFEMTSSKVTFHFDKPLKTGDEVLRGEGRITKPDAKPKIEGKMPLDILFSNGSKTDEILLKLEGFAQIRNAVHEVIAALTPDV